MKTIKIALFSLWGVLTVSLLILALIQRQEVRYLNSLHRNTIDSLSVKYIKLIDEYTRNVDVLRSSVSEKDKIDSICNTSELLKSFYNTKTQQSVSK